MSSFYKRKDGCYIYQLYYKDPTTKLPKRYQKNYGKLDFEDKEGEEDFLFKIESEMIFRDGIPDTTPLSVSIKRYLKMREGKVRSEDLSPNTLRTDKNSLNLFLTFIKSSFGNLKTKHVKKAHIEKWIEFRKSAGVSQTSINVNLRTVKSFFTQQKQSGRISKHPFEGIVISETQLNKDDTVIDYFTKLRKFILKDLSLREEGIKKSSYYIDGKEIDIEWFANNDWFIHYLWIMLNTGMRSGEVLNLQWRISNKELGELKSRSFSYLSADESKIDIYFKKKRRTIPVTSELSRSINSLSRFKKDGTTPKTYLFENERTNRPHTTSTVANMLKRLNKDIGLDSRHTPHSLRHGYVSILVSKNGDIIKISKAVGHSSSAFTEKRYMHLRAKEDLTTTMSLISEDD